MQKRFFLQHFLNCVLIFLLAFIVFWPAIKNDFTHYDDIDYVLENNLIREVSWGNITKIFTDTTDAAHGGVLFPLSIFTYAIEYHFFQLTPWIYHFDNLLLHALNAVLVYVLIWLISGRSTVALITSVLFTISPLRVESVAWVAERKDVLYSFFYLGALISYVCAVRNGPFKRGCLFAVCGLFVLSLLSKQQALSLPLVLLAIDFLYNRVSISSIFIEKAPLWMISIGNLLYAHASFHGQAQALPTLIFGVYTPLEKFFLIHDAVLVYLFKNFIPLKISLLYPYPEKMNGFFHFFIYCSPVIVWSMVLFLIKFTNRYRAMVFGGVFFLITITLPVVLIWYNAYFISDHYMYLPSIGLFYAAACILDNIFQRRNMAVNKLCFLLLGGYAMLMSMMSYQYCKAWQNDITVWTHVIDQYPDATLTSIAYNNRGHAYQINNEGNKALSDLSKAIDLSSRYTVAYLNRSLLFLQYRQYALALKDCESILAVDPNDVRAFNNMGFIDVSSGQYVQGVELLTRAIKMHPDFSLLYFNRGIGYMNLKQYKEAAHDFYTVMSLDPQNTMASSRYQQVLGLLK